VVVHDERTVSGATNVQFHAVDAEFDRCGKGRDGVLSLEHVQATVRHDH
jgi:hypothetical protein